MKTLTIAAIAAICHEANRILCLHTGDNSQQAWDNAEEWQRSSAIKGVEFRLANPNASAGAQHESWFTHKINVQPEDPRRVLREFLFHIKSSPPSFPENLTRPLFHPQPFAVAHW